MTYLQFSIILNGEASALQTTLKKSLMTDQGNLLSSTRKVYRGKTLILKKLKEKLCPMLSELQIRLLYPPNFLPAVTDLWFVRGLSVYAVSAMCVCVYICFLFAIDVKLTALQTRFSVYSLNRSSMIRSNVRCLSHTNQLQS